MQIAKVRKNRSKTVKLYKKENKISEITNK